MVKEYTNLSLLMEELRDSQDQRAIYRAGLIDDLYVIKHDDMYWMVYDDLANLLLKVADYINGRDLIMMITAVTC